MRGTSQSPKRLFTAQYSMSGNPPFAGKDEIVNGNRFFNTRNKITKTFLFTFEFGQSRLVDLYLCSTGFIGVPIEKCVVIGEVKIGFYGLV